LLIGFNTIHYDFWSFDTRLLFWATQYNKYLWSGRDDAVKELLPEARRRSDSVADSHQNSGEGRRQVEMVDEKAVVLEATERESDGHERDRSRPLSAVDEPVCGRHASRNYRTCRRSFCVDYLLFVFFISYSIYSLTL